jgi:hypothetical protein
MQRMRGAPPLPMTARAVAAGIAGAPAASIGRGSRRSSGRNDLQRGQIRRAATDFGRVAAEMGRGAGRGGRHGLRAGPGHHHRVRAGDGVPVSAPQLPDRCTIADVHAAMSPACPITSQRWPPGWSSRRPRPRSTPARPRADLRPRAAHPAGQDGHPLAAGAALPPPATWLLPAMEDRQEWLALSIGGDARRPANPVTGSCCWRRSAWYGRSAGSWTRAAGGRHRAAGPYGLGNADGPDGGPVTSPPGACPGQLRRPAHQRPVGAGDPARNWRTPRPVRAIEAYAGLDGSRCTCRSTTQDVAEALARVNREDR